MRIQPFRAIYPNFDFIASPDSFCADAKDSFLQFRQNGFFEQWPTEALYVYQIQTLTRRHIGLVSLDEVDDFFKGNIKKHEKTLSEREQKQMQLFLQWNAILKPVLLTYSAAPDITIWLENFSHQHRPFIETVFEKDAQTHRVWAVTEPSQIEHLKKMFAEQVRETYIADGHHRTTTVAMLHERLREKSPEFDFDHLFCAFFAADQLDILDYNRVVEGLKEVSIVHFLVKLSKIFDLEVLAQAEKPRRKHELVMLINKEWFRLTFKKSVLNRFAREQVTLDASLLNELVFREIFGIEDVRNDTRILYVEGARGLEGVRKVTNDDTKNRIGFALYPVAFGDLMEMADRGESLPPKSTYFEPRLRSGLLVKMLRE